MPKTNLSNWREHPHSQWSFQHVDQLIPVEKISAIDNTGSIRCSNSGLPAIEATLNNDTMSLSEFCLHTDTNALCIMHRGELIHEWFSNHYSPDNPHIVFSVSKSITATLAGVFVETGALNTESPVTQYVPEVAESAYGDCTVQQVLDMTVSTTFEEDYTTTDGDYIRYRAATAWNPPIAGVQDTGLHQFLTTIEKGEEPHGYRFRYRSPNSDLLGWIVERAGGKSLAQLLSDHIWQPMGAQSDAYITVDNFGASRSAGGICATPHDLLRLGELMRHGGRAGDKQIVPETWVTDCIRNGDKQVWQRGDFTLFLPDARYRNKWYQTDNAHNAFFALGIHGQWIYVDPVAETVIVKLSSMAAPVDEAIDLATLNLFERVVHSLSETT